MYHGRAECGGGFGVKRLGCEAAFHRGLAGPGSFLTRTLPAVCRNLVCSTSARATSACPPAKGPEHRSDSPSATISICGRFTKVTQICSKSTTSFQNVWYPVSCRNRMHDIHRPVTTSVIKALRSVSIYVDACVGSLQYKH